MDRELLQPTASELAARARADLRAGLPVSVAGTLLASPETLDAGRWAALAALGPLALAVTGRRAGVLRARAYDGDMARLAVPWGLDPGEARGWARAVADPASDLRAPMKGPLTSLRGGDAEPFRAGIALAKGAELLPAVIGLAAPAPPGVTVLPPGAARLPPPRPASVAAARLPMALAGAGRLRVFRDRRTGQEHQAVEVGLVDRAAPVLVRLHSACFTGDVLGSLKCDCGPQLHAALEAMREPGGVLLYLQQEGRGIGLANKMRAYDLQDQGFDTVEANHRLGFEDDERDLALGAALLREMNVGRIRLMTNNPRKVAVMEREGIEVAERVPLNVGQNVHNADYLAVKRLKSGHLP
jgi:GTP cyclohydrolase II